MSFAKQICFTNFYELNIGGKYAAAYFYTVKISKNERPRKDSTNAQKGPRKERRLGMRLNRNIFKLIPRRELGDQLLAYDGRGRACGMKRIPNDSLNLVIDFDDDKWALELSYEKAIPLSGVKEGDDFGRTADFDESLLCLALMLNHMPSISYTPLGRGFYGLPNEPPKPIGGGFELWSGYQARAVPGEKKMYLNVNYAITAFMQPGKLIGLLPELLDLRGNMPTSLHPRDVNNLKKKLIRCRAETIHLKKNRSFTIASVTLEPASKLCFTDRDGRKVSVADHFAKTHFKLQYPNFPCIQVGTDNPKFFPLEVVEIKTGNPYRGEQTPQLVSDIIKHAAIPPRNRLEEIRATVGRIREQNELASEFDMQLGQELQVPARIIPPPKLVAGGGRPVNVNPGVIDFRQNSFARGSKITKWTIILTDERVHANDVAKFAEGFVNQALKTGLQISAPLKKTGNQFFVVSDRNESALIESEIENFVNQNKLEFVIFIISDSSPIHGSIKFVCDIRLGIASKCVKSGTLKKVIYNDRPGPDQCVLNILYGLNPKFNGENVLAVSTEYAQQLLSSSAVLIIGIDVNHGQAKIRDGHARMPSTVGIVGTRNKNASLYSAFMTAQRKPLLSDDREVVQSDILKPALVKIFKNFFIREKKKKPERIVVYRDGVSDGQFNAVLDKEMRAIIEVCNELPGDNYRPPITFVTVQKRHNCRLFPKQVTKDFKGREKQNPVAGTVVDQILPNSRVWNFQMVTHEGIQGTSRPAHYSVLYDENGFTNDQIQSLTYYLCHLYSKCPRAVSMPAPMYYAHLVAFRAAELGAHKYFRSALASNSDARTHSSGAEGKQALEDEEKQIVQAYKDAIELRGSFGESMYFL